MMNENNIQTLNREEFTTLGLINLQKIFLKKSHVKYLHRETFKELKILVELDLSENLIEHIDKQTFSGNDRLRILLLYGNPIKKLIADQFPVLPYLRTIDLHNCEIVAIDETSFSNVDLLEYLDLKQNQIQSMPGNVFTHMKNLKTLLLDENPWNCDCKLKKFRNWYVKNNLNRISLQCKSPYSLLDQHWENIHEDAFGCAPILKILNEDVSLSDLESNITFKCYTTGDPRPTIGWQLDGKDIDNDNVVIDADESAIPHVSSVAIDQHPNGKIWSNLSIYNITNLNAGFYTCFARNDLGYASQNVSLLLPEVGYEHVLIKNNDTFWYFGLVVGIFGTIVFFLLVSIVFCVCRKVTIRRRMKKNIKGSVSFNDQEKKLLDLSITTTTDRERDFGELLNTPSSATNKTDSSIIPLEPVQITIENFHHPHNFHRRDEFPLNIGYFPPPPPEFCSAAATTQSSLMSTTPSVQQTNGQLQYGRNPANFGNIFISVSLTQDSLDNDLNMYPDLLNIVPNRMKSSSTANNLSATPPVVPTSQIVPINIESYATLPRNKLLNAGTCSGKAPVSILKQTKKNYDRGGGEGECMAGLMMRSGSSSDISNKCVSCTLKSDNMGLRVTASGNTAATTTTTASALSIPDEELEEDELPPPGRSDEDVGEHVTTNNNHHLVAASYHHNHSTPVEQFEQLSPPPPPKGIMRDQASASMLMPNDFVSL
jgi:Leucine rich repeat/Immunoglobulin domain